MGIIVQGKSLWRALFTRTQRRVIGLLFGHPERSYYGNELVRLAGVGTGSVQRELNRLADAGLVRVERIGNQKHYRANPDCPIYPELRSLLLKTLGAVDHLRHVLAGLDANIECAFLYGAAAESLASPGADTDLLLVSRDLKRADAQSLLEDAGARIGRHIRFTLLRPDRYRVLLREGDPRLQAVLAHRRIVLLGDPWLAEPETNAALDSTV
jgi:DNA-binding transcriptional ArsR family regulator